VRVDQVPAGSHLPADTQHRTRVDGRLPRYGPDVDSQGSGFLDQP